MSGSISPQIRRFSGRSITSTEAKTIEAMDGSPLGKTNSASQTSFNGSAVLDSDSVASLPSIIFSDDVTQAAGVVLTAQQASETSAPDSAWPGTEVVALGCVADGLGTGSGNLPNGAPTANHALGEGNASTDSAARATHSSSVPSCATHDDDTPAPAAQGSEAGRADAPDAASVGGDAASIKSESAGALDEEGERRKYHTLMKRLDPGRRTIG